MTPAAHQNPVSTPSWGNTDPCITNDMHLNEGTALEHTYAFTPCPPCMQVQNRQYVSCVCNALPDTPKHTHVVTADDANGRLKAHHACLTFVRHTLQCRRQTHKDRRVKT
jgi:hypothetical protein